MKISDIRDLSKDDVLAAFGLETRSGLPSRIFGTLGIFGVGVLVGGCAALLLAPKTGQDMRGELGQRLRSLRETAERNKDDDAQMAGDGDGLSSNSSSRKEIRP